MPNEKKIDEEHGVRLSYKFRIYPTAAQCEAIVRRGAGGYPHSPGVQPLRS